MARLLNNKTLIDKVQTSVLLDKANLLSVNQINAKIKIIEMWKVMNVEGYPLQVSLNQEKSEHVTTRAMTKKMPIEIGNTILKSKTCVGDAIRLWNLAPSSIHNCTNLYSLKKCTKAFVKTLPI